MTLNILESFWDSFYQNLIAADRYKVLLSGLGVTLQITVFAILLGTVLGVILAFMKISKNWFIRSIASVYVDIIRGTPLVVQLLITYFIIFGSVNISKIPVAIMACGFNSAAYVSEIVRAGIAAVDPGQMEAGRSLGLSQRQTMLSIIMPQAIKNILPAYANEFIVLIKETAIVGYIAVEDLTKAGDMIRSRTFDAFFPLITVALIYLAITGILSKLFKMMERRLARSDRG